MKKKDITILLVDDEQDILEIVLVGNREIHRPEDPQGTGGNAYLQPEICRPVSSLW